MKNNIQMETFSDRLSQAIESSGLKRPEFAARAGVGTSALAKWLAGKLTPKSEQLLSLAQVAGTSMEWLLTGKDVATRSPGSVVKEDPITTFREEEPPLKPPRPCRTVEERLDHIETTMEEILKEVRSGSPPRPKTSYRDHGKKFG